MREALPPSCIPESKMVSSAAVVSVFGRHRESDGLQIDLASAGPGQHSRKGGRIEAHPGQGRGPDSDTSARISSDLNHMVRIFSISGIAPREVTRWAIIGNRHPQKAWCGDREAGFNGSL